MPTFGERLRAAREMAGLSQDDLADLLGMARTNYVRAETKNMMPSKYDKRIAEILAPHVTESQLTAWRAIDQYPPETFETATVIHRAQQILKDKMPNLKEGDLVRFRDLIDAEILRRFGPKSDDEGG